MHAIIYDSEYSGPTHIISINSFPNKTNPVMINAITIYWILPVFINISVNSLSDALSFSILVTLGNNTPEMAVEKFINI